MSLSRIMRQAIVLPLVLSSVAAASPKYIYQNHGQTTDLEIRGSLQPESFDHNSAGAIVQTYRGRAALGILDISEEERTRLIGARLFPFDYFNNAWRDFLEIQPVWTDHTDFKETEIGKGLYATIRHYFGDHYLKVKVGAEQWRTDEKQQNIHGYARFGITSDVDVMASAAKYEENSPIGYGVMHYLPHNLEVMATGVRMNDSKEKEYAKEFTMTVGIARHADYRKEKYPTGFLVWRTNEQSDFVFWGLYQGNSQLVKPATVGIMEGMFYSAPLISDLRNLRQFNDFGVFSNDYENATWSFQGAYLDQAIIPQTDVKVGFIDGEVYYSPKNFFVHGELTREVFPDFRNMSHTIDWYGKIGAGAKLSPITPQASITLGNEQTGTEGKFAFNIKL
ncbi:hypothetical protein C4573_03715 [Candidatus Woesearchaeota archaeon]|nr:MAG: hypothetical protein C4573_03715 [Candidatus Woesearchaeota archaeon]